jgi:hypothetical protein
MRDDGKAGVTPGHELRGPALPEQAISPML